MSMLKTLVRRYSAFRDETDRYLMAATLAQVGEIDLAREVLGEQGHAEARPTGEDRHPVRAPRDSRALECAGCG